MWAWAFISDTYPPRTLNLSPPALTLYALTTVDNSCWRHIHCLGHRRTVRSVLRFSFACDLRPHAKLNPRTPLAGVFLYVYPLYLGSCKISRFQDSWNLESWTNSRFQTYWNIESGTCQDVKIREILNLGTFKISECQDFNTFEFLKSWHCWNLECWAIQGFKVSILLKSWKLETSRFQDSKILESLNIEKCYISKVQEFKNLQIFKCWKCLKSWILKLSRFQDFKMWRILDSCNLENGKMSRTLKYWILNNTRFHDCKSSRFLKCWNLEVVKIQDFKNLEILKHSRLQDFKIQDVKNLVFQEFNLGSPNLFTPSLKPLLQTPLSTLVQAPCKALLNNIEGHFDLAYEFQRDSTRNPHARNHFEIPCATSTHIQSSPWNVLHCERLTALAPTMYIYIYIYKHDPFKDSPQLFKIY